MFNAQCQRQNIMFVPSSEPLIWQTLNGHPAALTLPNSVGLPLDSWSVNQSKKVKNEENYKLKALSGSYRRKNTEKDRSWGHITKHVQNNHYFWNVACSEQGCLDTILATWKHTGKQESNLKSSCKNFIYVYTNLRSK